MNSAHPSQSPRKEIDPSKTARVLANLQRVTAPAEADPVMRVVESPTVSAVDEQGDAHPNGPNQTRNAAESRGGSNSHTTPEPRSVHDTRTVPESRSSFDARPSNESRHGVDARPRRIRSTGAETIAEKPFEVSTGKGIKMLNVRVPKDLHARLTLIATRNKIADNGQPATITDLAIDALREIVDRHEAA